ncbi:hypothetical protein ETD83_12035 [Actinomadura soli]|uniref:Uncharacterized protein n=1 Tax=Actinomadura soli TaxID=2508997 RepID=A0A5C4JEA5_9ACTN|nr:hypothetical protein [Actinomadura soli]TMR02659.1 hypothetical protein ETD83_12035 [Actinomadura soli]
MTPTTPTTTGSRAHGLRVHGQCAHGLRVHGQCVHGSRGVLTGAMIAVIIVIIGARADAATAGSG